MWNLLISWENMKNCTVPPRNHCRVFGVRFVVFQLHRWTLGGFLHWYQNILCFEDLRRKNRKSKRIAVSDSILLPCAAVAFRNTRLLPNEKELLFCANKTKLKNKDQKFRSSKIQNLVHWRVHSPGLSHTSLRSDSECSSGSACPPSRSSTTTALVQICNF